MPRRALIALVFASSLLAGCDMLGGALGIESPEKLAAAREADGKAIGGACRHAGRAIEDCYALNKKADKASVFAGWRDMNDYMRENKIDPVAPQGVTQVAGAKAALVDADASVKPSPLSDKPADKPAAKGDARRAKAHDS
ncbi:MAG: hypothetical protein V4569_00150 [Pseudomonadota bacterium]